MSGRAELVALAERVEAAAGPDRGLDGEIAVRIDGPGSVDNCSPAYLFSVGNSYADIGRWGGVPKFTASLDSALTLVPISGYGVREFWHLSEFGPGCDCECEAHIYGSIDHWQANAKSPALALCAAALRARATMMNLAP